LSVRASVETPVLDSPGRTAQERTSNEAGELLLATARAGRSSVGGSGPGGAVPPRPTDRQAWTRAAWVEVDLAAVRGNARLLAAAVDPARLLAVVKADAYGHGALPVARAALEGGATHLGVALAEEGVELRRGGIEAPILVLAEPPPAAAGAVVAGQLTPVVYTPAGVAALAAAVRRGGAEPLPVHLKVDTGMHRVGCSPGDVVRLAVLVANQPELRLEGLLTHLAVADAPSDPYTARQLSLLHEAAEALREAGLGRPLLHAANSAATLSLPGSHLDLVRCGIALYGLAPAPCLEGRLPLRPVLSLRARIVYVKKLAAGERLSYGRRYELRSDARVATVPLGYADGVPRRLGEVGGEVLVGGRRRRIAGTVTMDQLLVDLGDDPVGAGEEVVLLGRQGEETMGAAEWAERLDTIPYEILCGISARVPRHYV
ncbi:MAG: alanine racemase, partial [Acidimicrobiia bacterium]